VSALVTGVTGKVGNAIARALASRGCRVRALVLDPETEAAFVPSGVEVVRGDVTEPPSIQRAMAGCRVVFNAMGVPEQWLPDQTLFDRVNARGTDTVIRAAIEAGVRRVVHTSTVEVFGAEPGSHFDETAPADAPKATPYERSKQKAERLALAAADRIDVVIVNPPAVYGPGPPGSASLEKALFEPLVRGRLPLLPPGGFGLVLNDSLAAGQLLAAERGRSGERYIVSDGHLSMRDLAGLVVETAGRGRVPPTSPIWVARALAATGDAVARSLGRPPRLSRGELHSLLWDPRPDSTKAQRQLGWQPVPLQEGIRATLEAHGLLDR
jgi:dihydroflavonol-4-reductase